MGGDKEGIGRTPEEVPKDHQEFTSREGEEAF